MYGIHCIVMLFVHTWRAQLLLSEHVTVEELLFELPALVLLSCQVILRKELGLHCAELAAVLCDNTIA